MKSRLANIYTVIASSLGLWCSITLILPLVYYIALMASLVIRFGNLPNYITFYDWGRNVMRILDSTPSIRDSISIIKDEWLLEIGYMNYDFGTGISEWSLFIVPVKVFIVIALGALVATNFLLLRSLQACFKSNSLPMNFSYKRASGTATGLGAALVATASVSLSWVVCCSTPTWVVGLSMLGLGASTALWLEPLGSWMNALGFIILVSACLTLAGQKNDAETLRLERTS